MNIEKGETSDSSLERRRDSRKFLLWKLEESFTLYENINLEEIEQIEIEWTNKYGVSKIKKLLKKIGEGFDAH